MNQQGYKVDQRGKDVTIEEAVSDAVRGWISFKGYTSCKGFWYAQLSLGSAGVILVFLLRLFETLGSFFMGLGLFTGLFILILGVFGGIASCASSVRRLRDVGLNNKGILLILVLSNILTLIVPPIAILAHIAVIYVLTRPSGALLTDEVGHFFYRNRAEAENDKGPYSAYTSFQRSPYAGPSEQAQAKGDVAQRPSASEQAGGFSQPATPQGGQTEVHSFSAPSSMTFEEGFDSSSESIPTPLSEELIEARQVVPSQELDEINPLSSSSSSSVATSLSSQPEQASLHTAEATVTSQATVESLLGKEGQADPLFYAHQQQRKTPSVLAIVLIVFAVLIALIFLFKLQRGTPYKTLDDVYDTSSYDTSSESSPYDEIVTEPVSEIQTVTLEYEDDNGYTYQVDLKIGQWIKGKDSEKLQQEWQYFGNYSEFETLGLNTSTAVYLMGTISFKNTTTGGFLASDISNLNTYIQAKAGLEYDYNGSWNAKVAYNNGPTYGFYRENFIEIAPRFSEGLEDWGPVTFVIGADGMITPNSPNGLPGITSSLVTIYNARNKLIRESGLSLKSEDADGFSKCYLKIKPSWD